MNKLAPDFDRLTKIYRWMEYFSFGRGLERCRFFFLDRCADARHALVLGDGDGRYTQQLAQRNARVQIDAMDASPRMLQALREHVALLGPQAAARLRTTVCDLRTYDPQHLDYDLVASHFFLDCLTEAEIEALANRLRAALAPRALWIVSEFSIPQSGWMHHPARAIIAALYFAFHWMTRLPVHRLPNYVPILQRADFTLVEKKSFLSGLITAEVWRYANR